MPVDQDVAIIEPKKAKREESVPVSGVLVFTPQDLQLFLGSFPEPPRLTHRVYLADVYCGTCKGVSVAFAGPVLGAPQAVLVLEKLIALGVRNVVTLGWCGSLQKPVCIGDVVLPAAAVSEEGTSAHYPIAQLRPGPDPEFVRLLGRALQDGGLTVHEGKVWTTDAPYRETVSKVLQYQEQGVLGVEMETSALFTLAHFRDIRLATVLIVSDELSSLTWVHGFRDSRFQQTRKKVVELTLRTIHSI